MTISPPISSTQLEDAVASGLESIDETIKNLIKLLGQFNRIYNNKDEDRNQEKLTAYNLDVIKALNILENYSNDNKYIKLSDKNNIIVWGHPRDPDNEDKQIIYKWNPEEQHYIIISGKSANAYIINGKDANVELITIQNGYQESHGKQKIFQINNLPKQDNAKMKEGKILDLESQERFNLKFKETENLRITRPFFISDIKQFEQIKMQLFSSDKKAALTAFNKLNVFAKAHSSNSFRHTIQGVAYRNQQDDWIFGFDDNYDIRGNERCFATSGSKYSFAYRIAVNAPDKLEVIASDLTRDAYILAIKNPDSENQTIEMLELGDGPKKAKLYTVKGELSNTNGEIIEYNSDKNKDCPALCSIIRGSGNSLLYGINTYHATNKFIEDVKLYIAQQEFNEQYNKLINKVLKDALSPFNTNALVMIFAPKLLHEKELTKFIKKAIDNIKNQHITEEAKILSVFIKEIDLWKNSKSVINKIEEQDAQSSETFAGKLSKEHPKLPANIKIDPDYQQILSFHDENCKNDLGNFYHGKVFLFQKQDTEFHLDRGDIKNNMLDNSFILEIQNEPFAIRARAGFKGDASNVNAVIKYNDYELRIQNGEIIFDDIEFSPFKNTIDSSYACQACTDYYQKENQKLLFDYDNKTQTKQIS